MKKADDSGALVIVLGWNYSTSLGIVRSLGMAGFTVDLYFIARERGGSRITASSRYLRYTTEHVGRDDEGIIADLENKYGNESSRCVLVPTDDYSASLLDRYYDRLSPRFLMPHMGAGEAGAITRMMDKTIQSDLASAYGLQVVPTQMIDLPEKGEIRIPDGIRYPCFVKSRMSLDGRKTEMRKNNNEEELRTHLSLMRNTRANRTVIVQDYIDIDEEYSISGLCLDQTVILPALLQRLCVGKHERGVTIVGKLVPLEETIRFVPQLKDMLKSLHFTGLFCIDLFRSGDRFYFNEMNLRCAGSVYGFVKAGANLPAVLVKSLLGNPWLPGETEVTCGKTFFYDKVGWEDLVLGLCSRQEFNHYLQMSDYTFMKDPDDPAPGEVLYAEMERQRRKNQIKRMFPIPARIMGRILSFLRNR